MEQVVANPEDPRAPKNEEQAEETGGVLEPRKGRRVPKWLRFAGIGIAVPCLALLAILLAPSRHQSTPIPVSTAPVPGLDRILGVIEARLRKLDKGKGPYPSETELQSWAPKGVKLLVRTGSPDILILEISNGDGVWRSITHERDKPEATTYVTLYREKQELLWKTR